MAFTEEPPGLKWINNISTSSFGSLVSNALWAIGSIAFTWAACVLLLRQDGPSLTNGIPTSHEAQRQLGFALAGALLGAWTGKTIAGVVDAQQKRTADPRYKEVLEAKERGKVAGAAAATVLVEKAKDAQAARLSGMYVAPVTVDHPAQPAPIAQVNIGTPPPALVADPPDAPLVPDGHQWADGTDAKAGVL